MVRFERLLDANLESNVNLSFYSCRLKFDVSCPQSLSDAVRTVVGPFEDCATSAHFGGRVEIGHGLQVGQASLEQEGIPREYLPYLSLRASDVSGIRVGLDSGSAWEVSAAIGMLLARGLAEHRGLLLHASMLSDGEGVHLLLGPSGAGKSTAADLARPMICIHDDKAAVRRIGGVWLAFGTPLLGNLGRPGLAKEGRLASLNLVVKSSESRRIPMNAGRAAERLAENAILPAVADRIQLAKTFLDLTSEIPAYELHFSKRSRVSELLR